MDLPEIVSRELIAYIKKTYQLHWDGIHGYEHWVRVYENGMRMSALNGANPDIVALFAFTHDMDRQNDGRDPQHGPRAAVRIREELQGKFFQLTQPDLDLLILAVALHTRGQLDGDITVQTCWDSDRLDLGRVGITPAKHLLCTTAARDPAVFEWAYKRSIEARHR